MGDLNVTLDPTKDSVIASTRHNRSRQSVIEWLASIGVVDCWRLHHPEQRLFTGPPPRKNRLDYCLLSERFMTKFYDSSRYFQVSHSGDHLAHSVTLNHARQQKGKGYWRLSSKMLDCPLVREAIKTEAEHLLPEILEAQNPGLVWEGWKKRMANQLQTLQSVMTLQKDQGLRAAESRLEECMRAFAESPSETTETRYQEAKAVCAETKEFVYRLQQDSAFDFHASKMENSSSAFFRPPKTQLRSVQTTSTRLEDGEISTDPEVVKDRFRSHWGTIFGDPSCPSDGTTHDKVKQEVLLRSITESIADNVKNELDSPITAAELTEAIKHMKSNSAPGLDGLTAAFYQTAPELFGAILCRVFHYQLERGILLPSQRKSCITLLYKKGDRSDAGNYRPIALMAVDVKILSKTLTYRLKDVLPSIIHNDQKGFVKGRSLHHQVRLLDELQHQATQENSAALALFLDFENAYDRVIWEYLFLVLARLGFGCYFISWIRLLYNKPLSILLLNGYLLKPLEITRGVKQGDPLSSLLFLLCIEPLGNLIRAHRDLGVSVNTGTTATSLYFADDSTLVSRSMNGIRQQLELVETYCQGSGARLNLKKSALMPLNRKAQCPVVTDIRCLQPMDSIKYLGIPFGQQVSNDHILAELNNKFYRGFGIWGRRARTLRGRLLLTQTLIVSTLWHFTPHTNIPLDCIQRWQRMLNKFILSKKHDSDSYFIQLAPTALLYQTRQNGGIQIPNLQVQLKVQRISLLQQFVRQLRRGNDDPWPALVHQAVTRLTPCVPVNDTLSFLDISPKRFKCLLHPTALSAWWRASWRLWHETSWPAKGQHPTSLKSLLQAPIWLSKSPELHYETRSFRRRNLVAVAEPRRSFRLHVARKFSFACLLDIYDAFCGWPSNETFLSKTLDPNENACSFEQQRRWLRGLYNELTQIFHRVETAVGGPGIAGSTDGFTPNVGVKKSNKTTLFPFLQRSTLKLFFRPKSQERDEHPICRDLQGTSASDVTKFVQFCKKQRQVLLPVQDDLQMRIAYRLLPVRSRFWFLAHQISNVQQCPYYGCAAIETAQHLFLECHHSKEIWEALWKDWGIFFVGGISWTSMVLPHKQEIRSAWSHQ